MNETPTLAPPGYYFYFFEARSHIGTHYVHQVVLELTEIHLPLLLDGWE